jgi:aerobic C4-dicarboxylate transport protein
MNLSELEPSWKIYLRSVRHHLGKLYTQVLIAVALGIVIGCLAPDAAKGMKPLGDGFIKLVKMLIAPLVFCTIVHGVASMGDLRRLGRVGFKALLYFESISTIALFFGLVVVNLLRPGDGFPAQDLPSAGGATPIPKNHNWVEFALGIIPSTVFSPFVNGEMLQVLFVSLLVAIAVGSIGSQGRSFVEALESATSILFAMLSIVVRLAPLGAFGAMAFTIGNHGLKSLWPLIGLMACFYLTSGLFVIGVLGTVARCAGFSIFRFLLFLRDEILLVIGTSSSETAMPGLMSKLRKLGCGQATVGLVVPTGYSFNLDGTNIYMTMAAIFLAQATNTSMSLLDQIILLVVAMVTSKGSTGVTGAGFVTLAATISAVPSIPVESLTLLVGIDRFMSECRAITNFIGNGVAAVVVSRWEGEVSATEVNEKMEQLEN